MQYARQFLSLLLVVLVSGCSSTGTGTLGSLKNKSITIERNSSTDASVSSAIETYEEIIRDSNNSALNEKSLRRLGDLEMQRVDKLRENNDGEPENEASYDKAIDAYQTLLRRYPGYADREAVMYQLARAYEQSGMDDKAVMALKIFMRDHPKSEHITEVSFRLGEILFLNALYSQSEFAYRNTLAQGQANNKYYEQSLFKYAWSIYKQDRCLESLDPFFSILDMKLAINQLKPSEIEKLDYISRSDSETVEESFRAIILCIITNQNLETLEQYLQGKRFRGYEFVVYSKLAETYLSQGRENDAAEVYSAYFKRSDWHPYGVILHDKAINIYTRLKSKEDIIAAKKEYVRRFDILGEHLDKTHHNDYLRFLIKSDTASLFETRSRLKIHLLDIAKYHHAKAQKTDNLIDFQEAAKWYRIYLKHFPQSEDAQQINLLLAEALFEDKLYGEAAREFERVAYEYGKHEGAAEAGYAALLAYIELDKLLTGEAKKTWNHKALQSALAFARDFTKDPRVPAVLAKAAHELYLSRQYNDAMIASETLLHRYPDSDPEIRRTALIILANTQYELANFESAELLYTELMALIKPDDPLQTEFKERLATSIYKQAENLRSHGAISSAIDEFKRIIETLPDSTVRPIAEFDLASTYVIMDRWQEAADSLEAFKKNFPRHRLNKDAEEKLAVIYMHLENPLKAAAALQDVVKNSDSEESRRDALWQAAQLYEKGGEKQKAATTYNAFADMFPNPLEPAIEALYKAGEMHLAIGRDYNYRVQLEKIYEADKNGGGQRTNRTRYLAAQAAFVLAEPHFERYARVQLVEPIRKNMQLKNQLMKQALNAYNKVADLGVAEYTTAATYRIADMYTDFSRKLMSSDRPNNLDDEEMEQYEIMLEEQAFPFEEQAIELHESNIQRMRENGLYNEWIENSFKALATLMPSRYSRSETHAIAADTAY